MLGTGRVRLPLLLLFSDNRGTSVYALIESSLVLTVQNTGWKEGCVRGRALFTSSSQKKLLSVRENERQVGQLNSVSPTSPSWPSLVLLTPMVSQKILFMYTLPWFWLFSFYCQFVCFSCYICFHITFFLFFTKFALCWFILSLWPSPFHPACLFL